MQILLSQSVSEETSLFECQVRWYLCRPSFLETKPKFFWFYKARFFPMLDFQVRIKQTT